MSAEEDGGGPLADQSPRQAHADRMREVARIQNANPSRSESQTSPGRCLRRRGRAVAGAGFSQDTGSTGKVSDLNVVRRSAASGRTAIAKAAVPNPDPTNRPRPGQDPRSQQIIAKLEELVPMKFQEETPLEDVIKHIREATKSSDMPAGIPIYVDPVGLSEADKTMNSTVRSHRSGRSSAPPDAATGSLSARPRVLRRGRDALHHVTQNRRQRARCRRPCRRPRHRWRSSKKPSAAS